MEMTFIEKKADEIFELMVSARRHIHSNPELSGHEFATQEYIISFLDKEGIENKKIADTGVIAIINGKPGGKVVAFRADIDALPMTEENTCSYASANTGVMHACGHDSHVAVLLGLAKFFSDCRQEFAGSVKLFFQPAEETVGGADRMIKEGCMENPVVDYVLGLHVMPYLPYGQAELKFGALNAATDTLEITVQGKTGHAAYPDKCVDSIVIAAQIISALQTIVSRNISPLDSAVFSIGKITGGSKSNIIADKVVMEGTVRSSSPEVRDEMLEKLEAISKSIAGAMGGGCSIRMIGDGYPALVNDTEIVNVVKEVATEYLGDENVFYKDGRSMGGEDFSFFLQKTKGAFYHIGCKLDDRPAYALHTPCFDIDERCLKTGLMLQVLSGLKLLEGEL